MEKRPETKGILDETFRLTKLGNQKKNIIRPVWGGFENTKGAGFSKFSSSGEGKQMEAKKKKPGGEAATRGEKGRGEA